MKYLARVALALLQPDVEHISLHSKRLPKDRSQNLRKSINSHRSGETEARDLLSVALSRTSTADSFASQHRNYVTENSNLLSSTWIEWK